MTFLLCLLVQVSAQQLVMEPEQPTPGQKITITYDPTGTPLEGQEFETTAYLFSDTRPVAVAVEMSKKGNVYSGTVEATPETKVLYIGLSHPTKDLKDDNDKKGYGTLFYKDGKVIPGAYANYGLVLSGMGRFANVDVNREKALKKLKKEFSLYPESKKNKEYMTMYANLAKRLDDQEAKADVKSTYSRDDEAKALGGYLDECLHVQWHYWRY